MPVESKLFHMHLSNCSPSTNLKLMSSEDAIGTVVSVQSPTQMLPPSMSSASSTSTAAASAAAGSVLRPANQAPTSLTRDDSSITSGSSGFGSLPKKKLHTPEKPAVTPANELVSMHESNPLAASIANSLVTDSGLSESSDAITYSADNARHSQQHQNQHHPATVPLTAATPTSLMMGSTMPPSLATPLTASTSASSSSPLSVLNHPSTAGQLQAGVGLPLLSHPHSPVAANDLGHSRNSSNTSQVRHPIEIHTNVTIGNVTDVSFTDVERLRIQQFLA